MLLLCVYLCRVDLIRLKKKIMVLCSILLFKFFFHHDDSMEGHPSKKVCNIQHYTIRNYQDLDPFLGSYWHFRGLNINGDYGYVQLDTVNFCFRKSRSLVEYFPPSSDDQPPSKTFTDTGHILSFSFVCKYGIGSTFGKDKKNFLLKHYDT